MTGAVAIVGYALDCWLAIPEGEELTLSRTEERLAPAVDRLAEWLEQRPGRQARREQILRSSVAGVRTAAALDALLDRYEAVYPGSVREGCEHRREAPRHRPCSHAHTRTKSPKRRKSGRPRGPSSPRRTPTAAELRSSGSVTSIESALRALVEEQTASLRARVEALERERVVRETPLALLSVRVLAERHPAYTERALRALIARRHRNGLQASGAIVRQRRRVLIHERRFVAWAEGMTERPTKRPTRIRPSVAARRPGHDPEAAGRPPRL